MFRTNRCVENDMNMGGNPNNMCGNMNNNMGMMNPSMGMMNSNMVLPGMECEPIYECPCEKVCHREINHHIEHIQPINTRIINHHVYHHSYKPCYTCCEENEVCNVYDCNPCNPCK